MLPRLLLLLLTAVLLLSLGGCVSQKQFAQQTSVVDSLRVVNRQLTADVYAFQDSLQFYDDIDSGQYYRDMRVLRDSIYRLRYELDESRRPIEREDQAIETLQVDDLFMPASATFKEDSMALLDTLAALLQAEYASSLIRIEAHSDNVPPGPSLREKYPSNWELSAARAAAVVRYLTEKHDLEPTRFELVSLGDVHPATTNTTATGRRQNRRIRVYAL